MSPASPAEEYALVDQIVRRRYMDGRRRERDERRCGQFLDVIAICGNHDESGDKAIADYTESCFLQ